MQYTSLGNWLVNMPSTLARYGVDGQALLAELGVSEPADRLPTTITAQAWRQAALRSGDPAIALHAAGNVTADAWGALGRAIRYCENLQAALQLVTRFPGCISTSVAIALEPRDHGLAVITRPRSGLLPGHESMEFGMAAGFQILQAAAQQPLSLAALSQTRPRPTDPTPWQEYYRCRQVSFGQLVGEQVYPWDQVRRPLPDANPARLAQYQQQLQLQCPPDAYDPFLAQVERHILDGLARGQCDQRWVADTLNISSRHLQRQLKQRALCFSSLVERLRAAQAARLLANPSHNLNDIALQLGFSDHSNFSRAFRRWYGLTPSAYREQNH